MAYTATRTADQAIGARARPRRRWLRYTLAALAGLLGFGLLILLYTAYVYQPPEDRTDIPAYLAWMQVHHLDHYVTAGNFRLHYLHVGSGEPVVLLPGGGAWIYDFRSIVTALAPHYSVYAIDPPGDGYTTPLAKNPNYNRIYTLASIDHSLLAFMNTLHLRKAAFVGNSWGGGYALYFAERHPARVSRLVSLDGEGLKLDDTGGQLSWQVAGWPVLGEVELKLTATPGFVRQELEGLLIHRAVTADMVREFYIPYTFHSNLTSQWVLTRNLDWGVTERLLPALKTPTLIIWGKQDTLMPAHTFVPRYHQVLPRARMVVINHAGHLVHEDQPARVDRLLRRFLSWSGSHLSHHAATVRTSHHDAGTRTA